MLIGDIQNNVSIVNNSITGTLNGLDDWLWDPFSFENGVVGSPPYHFIALDFSDNDFEGLTSATVQCRENPVFDLLNDDDKIVILEVSRPSTMIVKQSNGYKTLSQMIDLSGLVLLSE